METRVINLVDADIYVMLDNVRIGLISIPSGYISDSFMPLAEEHVVRTGDELENGNIVVLAESRFRRAPEVLTEAYALRNPGFKFGPGDRAAVQETSRWAMVYDLVVNGDIARFNLLYADGTVLPKTVNKSIKWAVQKRVQVTPVCPKHGYVHTPDRPGDLEELGRVLSDIVNRFVPGLGDIFSDEDQAPRMSEAEIPAERDTEAFEAWLEQHGTEEDLEAFKSNVTFAAADTSADASVDDAEVQKMHEDVQILEEASRMRQDGASMEEILEQLKPKRPRPIWVEGLQPSELQRDDWIQLAGNLYKVIAIGAFTDGGADVVMVPLHNYDGTDFLQFALPGFVRLNIRRRVKQ